MTRGVRFALCSGLALVASLGAGFAFDYVTCDGSVANCPILPIDDDLPVPQKNAPFVDSDYHTTVARVTHAQTDGLSCNTLINAYATMKIENADHSYILVSCATGPYYLYNANTLQYIKQMNMASAGENREPYWDPVNPERFYYRAGARFLSHDVETNQSQELHDFTDEYPQATLALSYTKAEPSQDGRYWAFQIEHGGTVDDWVIYDKQLDQVRSWNASPAGQATPAYGAKWVGLSPSGNYFVMKNVAGSHYVAHADFQTPRVTLTQDSHGDFALDKNGEEVYVSRRPIGSGNGEGWSMTYLDDPGHFVHLLKAQSGFHVSGNCYDTPGYALFSTYQSAQSDWADYGLFMVELDPGKCWNCPVKPLVWRVAQTYTQHGAGVVGEYWTEAFATISQDGQRIYWGANWYDTNQPVDLYMVDMPPTWFSDLGGSAPVVPLPPANLTID